MNKRIEYMINTGVIEAKKLNEEHEKTLTVLQKVVKVALETLRGKKVED